MLLKSNVDYSEDKKLLNVCLYVAFGRSVKHKERKNVLC